MPNEVLYCPRNHSSSCRPCFEVRLWLQFNCPEYIRALMEFFSTKMFYHLCRCFLWQAMKWFMTFCSCHWSLPSGFRFYLKLLLRFEGRWDVCCCPVELFWPFGYCPDSKLTKILILIFTFRSCNRSTFYPSFVQVREVNQYLTKSR